MHKAPQLDQGECQHLILIQVPSAACSGRGPLGRPSRLLWGWNEQVGGHTEACTQSLHHRHAQLLLTPKDLADPAWRSEDRDHVRPREAVLIHEVPDQFRGARWSARPLALLIGSDQTRLCLQPSHVGGIVRAPQPINEGARARVPHRYRSRSELHPSHGLRINPVVLCMAAEEPASHSSAAWALLSYASPQGGQNLSSAATLTR